MKNQTIYQCTLKKPVSLVGLGLHSGMRSRITLRPFYESTWKYLRRLYLPRRETRNSAKRHNIKTTTQTTRQAKSYGHSLSNVEKQMAA